MRISGGREKKRQSVWGCIVSRVCVGVAVVGAIPMCLRIKC